MEILAILQLLEAVERVRRDWLAITREASCRMTYA